MRWCAYRFNIKSADKTIIIYNNNNLVIILPIAFDVTALPVWQFQWYTFIIHTKYIVMTVRLKLEGWYDDVTGMGMEQRHPEYHSIKVNERRKILNTFLEFIIFETKNPRRVNAMERGRGVARTLFCNYVNC